MQRTKISISRHNAFKADPVQIRRRANLLPIKGMLYAISHAIADQSVKSDAKSGSSRRRINGISKHFSKLHFLASGYDDDISPSEMLAILTSASRSYVNLFYSMKGSNRSSYIARHSNSPAGRSVSPERNLLLIPAIMASRRERRSLAYSTIIKGLYSMPARFLYNRAAAAMKLEAMQQGLGLKGAKDSALSRLSLSMSQMESMISRMLAGGANPESDEMIKELFVNEVVAISESEDMGLAEFISDKLSNGNISFRTALRMVRK